MVYSGTFLGQPDRLTKPVVMVEHRGFIVHFDWAKSQEKVEGERRATGQSRLQKVVVKCVDDLKKACEKIKKTRHKSIVMTSKNQDNSKVYTFYETL